MKPVTVRIHPKIQVERYPDRYVLKVEEHKYGAVITESIPVADDARELDMQYIDKLEDAEIKNTILNYLKE